jgi:hypothetical protein
LQRSQNEINYCRAILDALSLPYKFCRSTSHLRRSIVKASTNQVFFLRKKINSHELYIVAALQIASQTLTFLAYPNQKQPRTQLEISVHPATSFFATFQQTCSNFPNHQVKEIALNETTFNRKMWLADSLVKLMHDADPANELPVVRTEHKQAISRSLLTKTQTAPQQIDQLARSIMILSATLNELNKTNFQQISSTLSLENLQHAYLKFKKLTFSKKIDDAFQKYLAEMSLEELAKLVEVGDTDQLVQHLQTNRDLLLQQLHNLEHALDNHFKELTNTWSAYLKHQAKKITTQTYIHTWIATCAEIFGTLIEIFKPRQQEVITHPHQQGVVPCHPREQERTMCHPRECGDLKLSTAAKIAGGLLGCYLTYYFGPLSLIEMLAIALLANKAETYLGKPEFDEEKTEVKHALTPKFTAVGYSRILTILAAGAKTVGGYYRTSQTLVTSITGIAVSGACMKLFLDDNNLQNLIPEKALLVEILPFGTMWIGQLLGERLYLVYCDYQFGTRLIAEINQQFLEMQKTLIDKPHNLKANQQNSWPTYAIHAFTNGMQNRTLAIEFFDGQHHLHEVNCHVSPASEFGEYFQTECSTVKIHQQQMLAARDATHQFAKRLA